MDVSQIGKRAWSYAGVLQQAGLSCVEYVGQLTMLLFLKMADQLTEEPRNKPPIIPPEFGWKALLPLRGKFRDRPRFHTGNFPRNDLQSARLMPQQWLRSPGTE